MSNQVADTPISEDSTYQAIENNNKIWIFEEKYEDQPDYRHGHRILNAGSLVTSFDVKTNQWSGFHRSSAFLTESETSKIDELLFTFAGSIFMLIFNRFEGLRVESLWTFDEKTLEWSKHSEINKVLEQPTGDNTFGSKMLIVRGDQSRVGPYLVAKVNTSERTRFLLLQLEIGGGGQTEVKILHEIDDLFSILRAMDPLPFAAISVNQKIYITSAERGCGYRWRTEDILRFDLESKQLDVVKIGQENPAFGMMMATENHYDAESNSWIFFGSLSKIGGFHLPEGQQTSETRFYAISDLTETPNWKESDQSIQNPGREDIYVPRGKYVFLISKKKEIVKYPLGDFHRIPSLTDQ